MKNIKNHSLKNIKNHNSQLFIINIKRIKKFLLQISEIFYQSDFSPNFKIADKKTLKTQPLIICN